MKRETMMALLAAFAVTGVPAPAVLAQSAAEVATASNQIESLDVVEQAGSMYVRVRLKEPLSSPPPSFSVANPARIAFDFPWTANALGRTQQNIAQGDLRSANIVQVGDRTRLVLNMTRVSPYETRIEGREVIIALTPNVAETANRRVTEASATFPVSYAQDGGLAKKSIKDITFRRGEEGEGRIVVQLSDPETGIDIRTEGGNLVAEFLNTSLPEHLSRRSDVTDFGTPITSMTTQATAESVRLIVSSAGMWEHNAYQSDRQFVLEVRKTVEDPNALVQGLRPGEYGGDRLSLNFQNIDVRSVLQVIADFTNFNIVTSDNVQGNVTLRLKDVPWDQALDVLLQAKDLDMRKSGNVIWIAPADEIALREKTLKENAALLEGIEPLIAEGIQINYHKAEDVSKLIQGQGASAQQSTGGVQGNGLLSSRGTVSYDEKSNRVFVKDTASRLDNIRKLVSDIDKPPQQVLIEARIVEARSDFSKDLGVRLGVGASGGRVIGYDSNGNPIRKGTIGGGLGSTTAGAGQVSGVVDQVPGGLSVNMPVASSSAGVMSMVLWNNAATRFLNLELSALEGSGRGKIISSPRVLTANQVEANIEQGEIIHIKIIDDGEAKTKEISATLRLKVTPNITPDGRIQMKMEIAKDEADFSRLTDGIPAILTRKVDSSVIVENGGTVVIGGVYEEDESYNKSQVPLLGDVPLLGNLFKTQVSRNSRKELMIFITPRLVSDNLTLR